MKKTTIILAVLCLMAQSAVAETVKVESPDGKTALSINTDGALSYNVAFKGRTIVADSPMGFEFKGEKPMDEGFVLTQPCEPMLFTDAWDPVVKNKHAHVKLLYNEAVLHLRETGKDGRRMDLTARVYNDGVAFRYTLYASDTPGDRKITRELTEYRVPAGSYAWVGHNEDGSFTGSQESHFSKTPVAQMTAEEVDLLPLLVEIDKSCYIALMDACLDNFPGWYAAAKDGSIITRLAPLPGEDENGVKARFCEEQSTPWRVIMIADNPGRFIESEIIESLNPPCRIENPNWVNPGMMAWDHWWSAEVQVDMPTIKEYIDLAAAEGWPYMLVDWQWYGQFDRPEADPCTPAPQLDMQELLAYARQRNVRLWVWLHSTDTSRNDNYKKAFALYQQWGIAGVKIDFMDRMDQEIVNWYRRVVECAAEHHLMVNFHGAYHPDGIGRTWPNQVVREGVMGAEYSKWSNNITPEHNITLAFTRMLAGAMDYTPGAFRNEPQGKHRTEIPASMMNTRCAELSKFVVYEAPQCCVCDAPQFILGQPGADFLKQVPTTWDDTHFIAGYPGEYIALAKRKADVWYVGIMNNSQPRDLEIALDFLPLGQYEIEYWADGKKADTIATEVVHKTTKQYAQKPLKVHLAAGGGYVATITRVL